MANSTDSAEYAGFRITSVTVYTMIGDDNKEGIAAFRGQDGIWYPLVCADPVRAENYRAVAQDMATNAGKPVRILRFTNMEVVDILEP